MGIKHNHLPEPYTQKNMQLLDLPDITHTLTALVIIICAYLIRGITGFGSGLVAIPLLALIFPLGLVVPAISLMDYISAAGHGFRHRQHIDWHCIRPVIPFTLAGIVTALYLFTTVDERALKKGLGIFVLLFAVYSLVVSADRLKGSRHWAIPAGFCGGFISALFGTGGPFYVIYMQLRQLDKQAFRASAAAIFFLDGSSRITGYIFSGMVSSNTLIFIAAGFPAMLLGLYVGSRIHTNLKPHHFRRIISFILVGSGISLLLQG